MSLSSISSGTDQLGAYRASAKLAQQSNSAAEMGLKGAEFLNNQLSGRDTVVISKAAEETANP